jgi:hypothetical protein
VAFEELTRGRIRMLDLKVVNGTVVDGSGRDPPREDESCQ